MTRRLVNAMTVLSLLLFVAAAALWVRTDVAGRTDVLEWGGAGVFRCVEFSSDDMEVYVLHDPGFAPRPLRWHRLRGGWAPPPPPSNVAALPPGGVTWVMPSPASLVGGRFTTTPRPGVSNASVAAWHGGVPAAGFEYATFPGWYGPGTSLRSYRVSYFVVLLPAVVLPLAWLVRVTVRRWRFGRYGPGRCRTCGYDLRATPDHCPECGTAAATTPHDEAPAAARL